MLVGRVDDLHAAITGHRQFHQPLRAIGLEGRLDPSAVPVENPNRLAGEFPDGDRSVLGKDAGLTRKAVKQVSRRSDLE